MEGMTSAGFRMVFVGLESVSPEALKETKKNQNVNGDMLERVHTILGHGLEVLGGFIVGFDSDGPDIFDRQVEFIQKAGVPTAMLGRAPGPAQHTPRDTDASRGPPPGHAAPARPVRPRQLPDRPPRARCFWTGSGVRSKPSTSPRPISHASSKCSACAAACPRPARRSPSLLVWALRAILAQGLLSPYRRDYWRFLQDIWRWDKTRIVDAIRHAAPGHHFLLFTRRVVRPRLEAALRDTSHADLLPVLHAAGGEAMGVSASA